MLRRTVLALATTALGSLAVRPAVAFSEPFEQARFEAALAEGRPLLIEIAASWCPVCRTQKGLLTELFDEERYAEFVTLEVDFDTQKDVVRALGAQHQSTLIVFADGAEVARGVGDTNRDAIRALLDAAL